MLDVLRPDIAPVDDEQILRTAGKVQRAVHAITQIAGIEPAILGQDFAARFDVAEVARHDAFAAKIDAPAVPVGQLASCIVAYLHFVSGQSLAAIDDARALEVAGSSGNGRGLVVPCQALAVHEIDAES